MKDTGGPAHPCRLCVDPERQLWNEFPGITLRDWFAGQAMLCDLMDQGLEGRDAQHIAGMAYEMADAMLAERSKP